MEHVWKLNWKNEATFEGVDEVQIADGDAYAYEVQEHNNGEVVGTVWTEIPATRWEPADVAIVIEKSFESMGAAKAFLEQYDADAIAEDQRLEALMFCDEN